MKDFPPFQPDTVNECLWRRRDKRDDERILLTPKAVGVLNYLIERAGQLVTHDELLDTVWLDTFIQPQAVKKPMLETDASRARAAIRAIFGFYLGLPNYLASFRLMGFADADFADGGSDRLIDAMVARGDERKIRDRVEAHYKAGATHVCVTLLKSGDSARERAMPRRSRARSDGAAMN